VVLKGKVRCLKIEYKKAVLVCSKTIEYYIKEYEVNSDEIIIRIKAIGVCTSDCLNYLYDNSDYFGHEIVGEVITPFNEFNRGDKVVFFHKTNCRTCLMCQNGLKHICEKPKKLDIGFSEYLTFSNEDLVGNIYKIPEEIDIKHAVFIDSISCVIHGLNQISTSLEDKLVIILGNGFMAVLFAMIIELRGGKAEILGTNKKKNQLVKKLNNIKVCCGGTPKSRNYDIIIDTTGKIDYINENLQYLGGQGILLCFSRFKSGEFDFNTIRNKEINIIFSRFMSSIDIRQSIDLLASKKIDLSNLIKIFKGLDELEKVINLTLDNQLLRGVIVNE